MLIGKNESGKTTILKALHRLNPANSDSHDFNVTLEYPRWRLATDRKSEDLNNVTPIRAKFALEPSDIQALRALARLPIPPDAVAVFARQYSNKQQAQLRATPESVIRSACEEIKLDVAEHEELLLGKTIREAGAWAASHATVLSSGDNSKRAEQFSKLADILKRSTFLTDEGNTDADGGGTEGKGDTDNEDDTETDADEGATDPDLSTELWELCPKIFYFSRYDELPGEVDLNVLATKVKGGSILSGEERTMVALLRHAGEEPSDFLEEDYNSRKAELQAASTDLSRRAFKYWTQNGDLEVIFDTDMPVVGVEKNPTRDIRHRVLRIELRDHRHGGVETIPRDAVSWVPVVLFVLRCFQRASGVQSAAGCPAR